MDLFSKFNRKHIDDRSIDTLIGISKGLAADGKINHLEAEFLQTWLIQNQAASANPVTRNLLGKLSAMLEDGVLDSEESSELLSLLHTFTGSPSEMGELAKATSLPVDLPLPQVEFPGRSFLFTGTCAFGTRQQCHDATELLGGLIASGVTKKLNYLVIGAYVTDSWAHETFGRKIEKAVEYREQGVPLVVITEEHWVQCGDIRV